MTIPTLMKHAAFALALACSPISLNAADTKDLKARYLAAETLRLQTQSSQDSFDAFHLLKALADEGYPRAQDKLAYYFWRGIGTEPDLEQSANWYRKAIDGGREASRVSYGKLLLKMDNFHGALEQLNAAAQADVRGAKAQLAASHFFAEFGDISDVKLGRELLEELVSSKDVYAIRFALIAGAKGAKLSLDQDSFLADALEISRDSTNRANAKIAEALLRYLRVTKARKTRTLRAELLNNQNLREKIRLVEALHLTSEVKPQNFWQSSEEIVASAGPDNYANALFLTSRLDKNAYVRILQKEMQKRGYFNKRARGYLTKKTIQAINKLCKDHNIHDVCQIGPLKGKAIKAIANALALSHSNGQS